MNARVYLVIQTRTDPNQEAEVHNAALVFAVSEDQAWAAIQGDVWIYPVSDDPFLSWPEPEFLEIGAIDTSETLPIVMDPDGIIPATNETKRVR